MVLVTVVAASKMAGDHEAAYSGVKNDSDFASLYDLSSR